MEREKLLCSKCGSIYGTAANEEEKKVREQKMKGLCIACLVNAILSGQSSTSSK